MFNHQPKKSLGQNFLRDKSIINRIISTLSSINADHIIEIGPGKGALTYSFIKKYKSVTIIEKDDSFSNFWINEKDNKNLKNLKILNSDFLDIDSNSLGNGQNTVCFSSLPYNVSKKILFQLLFQHKWFNTGVFIIQKEVAQDYCSTPPNANFLSRVIELVGKCEYLFDVPPSAFTPKPRVNSAVIKIEKTSSFINGTEEQIKFLKFVKNLYGYKRKTIKNSIKMAYKKDASNLEKFTVNIDNLKLSEKRVEELTIEQLIKIWE
ncbi:MAG TPA: 16S rRNA (adenine(1518)-N(6)/adenine(1519)-N(6))-dimethyltransferase RsmA [Candidatus Dojkabacteria bacterium]|nr:16S rRNA (adenine(1518)-N(6)/adenine(1519)-N(6))-dimethyltransferase RsmA [Candidatus Dojkabacteria bacterium]HQF36430.1 16S rRNA (adenine(1518)-N(6)/adenine(1519)-N(6))-dimethyltransferase RsmA [Candidatus Dojkabacteria bacterium]